MDSLFLQMRNQDGLIFYNKQFQEFLEMNMADLKRSSLNNSQTFDLLDTQLVRADRNFNLLCNLAGIPYHLHWVTMRINGLKRPSDYRYSMKNLYFVDKEKLDALICQFREAQSIS